MKNLLLILIAVLLLMFLNACAVMDINSMDTAVPLKPGKIELSTYNGVGLDLSSAVVIDEVGLGGFASHDSDKDAIAFSLAGVKVNVGILPKVEFSGRVYTGGTGEGISLWGYSNTQSTTGYKAGLKVLCKQDKNYYLSLLPSVNVVKGESHERRPDQAEIYGSYDAYGLELQLLGSVAPVKYVTVSGVCKFNRNYYSEIYNGKSYGTYAINHWGVKANLKLMLEVPFIIVEIGNEFVPVIHGNNTNLTSFAFGIGMRI
jgi:hypothetical protein